VRYWNFMVVLMLLSLWMFSNWLQNPNHSRASPPNLGNSNLGKRCDCIEGFDVELLTISSSIVFKNLHAFNSILSPLVLRIACSPSASLHSSSSALLFNRFSIRLSLAVYRRVWHLFRLLTREWTSSASGGFGDGLGLVFSSTCWQHCSKAHFFVAKSRCECCIFFGQRSLISTDLIWSDIKHPNGINFALCWLEDAFRMSVSCHIGRKCI